MLKRLLSQAIGAGRPSPGPASPAPSTDLSSDDAPASSSAPELHTDLEQLETRQDVQQQEDIWRDAMEVQKNTAAQANTSEQQQHDGGGGDDATDSSSDVEMLDPGHIAPLSDALSDSDDDHKPSLAQLKASADASRASGRSAPLSGPSAARPTLLPTPPSSSAEAPIEKSETSVLDYFIRAQIEASRAQQEAERGTSLDMSALSSTDRIRAMGIQARTELLRTIEGALALPQQPSAAALGKRKAVDKPSSPRAKKVPCVGTVSGSSGQASTSGASTSYSTAVSLFAAPTHARQASFYLDLGDVPSGIWTDVVEATLDAEEEDRKPVIPKSPHPSGPKRATTSKRGGKKPANTLRPVRKAPVTKRPARPITAKSSERQAELKATYKDFLDVLEARASAQGFKTYFRTFENPGEIRMSMRCGHTTLGCRWGFTAVTPQLGAPLVLLPREEKHSGHVSGPIELPLPYSEQASTTRTSSSALACTNRNVPAGTSSSAPASTSSNVPTTTSSDASASASRGLESAIANNAEDELASSGFAGAAPEAPDSSAEDTRQSVLPAAQFASTPVPRALAPPSSASGSPPAVLPTPHADSSSPRGSPASSMELSKLSPFIEANPFAAPGVTPAELQSRLAAPSYSAPARTMASVAKATPPMQTQERESETHVSKRWAKSANITRVQTDSPRWHGMLERFLSEAMSNGALPASTLSSRAGLNDFSALVRLCALARMAREADRTPLQLGERKGERANDHWRLLWDSIKTLPADEHNLPSTSRAASDSPQNLFRPFHIVKLRRFFEEMAEEQEQQQQQRASLSQQLHSAQQPPQPRPRPATVSPRASRHEAWE